jgi:hypothetical protein
MQAQPGRRGLISYRVTPATGHTQYAVAVTPMHNATGPDSQTGTRFSACGTEQLRMPVSGDLNATSRAENFNERLPPASAQ